MDIHDEFSSAMTRMGLDDHEFSGGLAVAVSGGSDSTALALLASRWAGERGVEVTALVCDHGLRRESREEMDLTLERLADRGIHGVPLVLRMPPGPGIQERARDARYAAMLSVMRRRGIGALAIGHQMQDQAETVAHRLETSGTPRIALAGMSSCRALEDALLLRPLLGMGRGALRDFLRQERMSWIDDPSNENEAFTRVRIRRMLRETPGETGRLLAIAEDASHERDAVIREGMSRLAGAVVGQTPWGSTLLDPAVLGDDPAGLHAFRQVVHAASGSYPEKANAARLGTLLREGGTLGGAMAWRDGGMLWVSREPSAMDPPAPVRGLAAWDGRIRFGEEVPSGLVASALGQEGATRAKRHYRSALPHKVLAVAPAVFDRKGRIIGVPQIGLGDAVAWRPVLRRPPLPPARSPAAGIRLPDAPRVR